MSESEHRPSGWRKFATDCKLIGEALQPIAIMVAGVVALATYRESVKNDRDIRTRELSQSYYEKQLDLYLDAARVAARLATIDPADAEREKLVARFWELYWGELALVESRTNPQEHGPALPVETLMVEICRSYVSAAAPDKCGHSGNPSLAAALDLAHRESDEIRARWTKPN